MKWEYCLGTIFRLERLARGLSQSQVSKMSGVPNSTYCRIEYGRGANPGFATIARIGKALNLSLDSLAKEVGIFSNEEKNRK